MIAFIVWAKSGANGSNTNWLFMLREKWLNQPNMGGNTNSWQLFDGKYDLLNLWIWGLSRFETHYYDMDDSKCCFNIKLEYSSMLLLFFGGFTLKWARLHHIHVSVSKAIAAISASFLQYIMMMNHQRLVFFPAVLTQRNMYIYIYM